MVYLVGVNHGVQFVKEQYTDEQIAVVHKFGHFIRENTATLNIGLIAEEMDVEALARHQAISYTIDIANGNSVEHLFCNPTTEEKKMLNISSDADREKEWLKRISKHLNRNILFICGHDHLHTFNDLLRASGIECHIISEEYWGKELDPKEQVAKLLQQNNSSPNTGYLKLPYRT